MEFDDPEMKQARAETLMHGLHGFLSGLYNPGLRISALATREDRQDFCLTQVKQLFPDARLLPFARAAVEQQLDFQIEELCAVLLTIEVDRRTTLTSLARSLFQPHRFREEEDLRAMAKILEPEVKRLKANRFDQLAESLLGVKPYTAPEDRPLY
jgi:hypothetical protein